MINLDVMKTVNPKDEVAKIQPAAVNSGTASEPLARVTDTRPEAAVQRKMQQQAAAPVQRQENKTGLPDNLKSGIENLSGYSMDDVKVHRNSDKPAQLNAHAYAQGTDIHLGAGQEKHLPHEAWHVVQQKQGRVKPTMQMKGKVAINDDSGLEREADVMGAKALQAKGAHDSLRIQNIPKGPVQRLLWPKKKAKQPTGEDTDWEGSSDLKLLYEWADTEAEFQDWLDNNTPDLWNSMMVNENYDPHKKEDIKSFLTIVKKVVVEKPKTAPVQKEKPKKETAEELQVRLSLEHEKRREEEQGKRALERETLWGKDDYTVVISQLEGNLIAKAAWDLIVSRLKSGSIQENISGLAKYSYEDLLAAVLVWRTAAGKTPIHLIQYMSTFSTVEDKSERGDGGKNKANLVERDYQASFILTTEIGKINLHVDAHPPQK